MKNYILSLALVCAALALGPSPASAVVIDFESFISDNGQTIDTPYSEQGFTLSTVLDPPGWQTIGTLSSDFTDSTALLRSAIPGVTELTLTGGGPFSLVSIDLAAIEAVPGFVVTFTGDVLGGGTVTNMFQPAGTGQGAETFTFNGFGNVTKVNWSQEASVYQFDNIVASANNGTAVPEPTSLGLLGLGLAGLALIRRGARQQQG